MLKLALPPLSGTVASGVVPSENVTAPPGVPAAGFAEFTVAVKVTGCPNNGVDVFAASEIDVPYRNETITLPLP